MSKDKKDQNPIHLREKVEVVSTDKDPYHVTGSIFKVHPVVAEKLFKNKLATPVGGSAKTAKA